MIHTKERRKLTSNSCIRCCLGAQKFSLLRDLLAFEAIEVEA